MNNENKQNYIEALRYHSKGRPGKIAIIPTKSLINQRDLSLAYSPGVAATCIEISQNPDDIYKYTAKGNLVAVITNGTAVLGLGDLGPKAAKPVMEGKAVLFKNFADIDAIDIEIDTKNPEEFISAIKNLGHSFGGINLEDIKAPECFLIEERLQELMDIPVFHDDQHGTAIITAAGLINACLLTNRKFDDIKVVVNGAGSAAIACIGLLVAMGLNKNNVILCDTKGVIYKGRSSGMNQWKEKYALETSLRTLEDAIKGADVFLGLSVAGALTKKMVSLMALNPIIFAMANPDPEITPEEVMEVRDDAIIATGRSDYNNQINNVMGFPYIFRGALDVRAKEINLEMKIAASKALAELARKAVPDEVYRAYPERKMSFGKEYIIPVPFDPRLITEIPVAVARAAIESGAACRSDIDFKKYKKELACRINPVASYMDILFERASDNPQRIVFAEGEEEFAIKAAIIIRDQRLGIPILVGRANKIEERLKIIGLEENLSGIAIMNAAINDNIDMYIEYLYKKLQRKGYLYRDCMRFVKTDRNVFASCMVAYGDADCMITGLTKDYFSSFKDISKVVDVKKNHVALSYSIMISSEHNILIADNFLNEYPSPEELSKVAIQMAAVSKHIGYNPKIAMLSFANFGSKVYKSDSRVSEATKILDSNSFVDFEYEGEITADVALDYELMKKIYPFSRLSAPANILVMPDLYASSIATKLLQEFSQESFVGPILSGLDHPIQIVQMGATPSQIVNSAVFAALEAINKKSMK